MTVSPVSTGASTTGTAPGAAASGTGDLFAGLLATPALSGLTGGPAGGALPGLGVPGGPHGLVGEQGAVVPGAPVLPVFGGQSPTDPAVDGPEEQGPGDGEAAQDDVAEEPAGPTFSAAQVATAAQLVPIAPVLANAIRLDLTGAGLEAGSTGTAATSMTPVVTTEAVAVQVPVSPVEPAIGPVEDATVPASADAPSAVPAAGAPEVTRMQEPTQPVLHGPASTPEPADTEPAHTDPATETSTASVDGAAALGQPADASAAWGGGSGSTDARTGDDRGPASAPLTDVTAAAGSTAASASTTSAAPAGDRTASPTPASAVTGQVFAEVSRLVSRGDGTRRITITLQPEALGDVRVVLTVRNGEVHVRMAGSELAQQALAHGAPELHRLLESVGATSSQVVVGDQGFTSQYGGHADGHPSGQFQDGAGQDHTNHRNAWTRDGATSARDGAATRGHHPPHQTGPGTRTPLGVDVTM
jgi:flagellar hook-length control protein FliK